MDIHEHGFLLLALMFIQNVARNPVLVNNRLSAASYLSQPLASNLAKSHKYRICMWLGQSLLYTVLLSFVALSKSGYPLRRSRLALGKRSQGVKFTSA